MAAIATHVQGLIHKIQGMQKAEFESCIARGIITVAEDLPHWFKMQSVRVHDDWEIRQTSGGDGDIPVTLFIVPQGTRARMIWMEGQVNLAIGKGLSPTEAGRWAHSRVKQKHLLFDLIVKAKTDENYRAAYLNYTPTSDPILVKQWARGYQIDDCFSRSHRLAISTLFKELFL